MLRVGSGTPPRFSSLSESGFIPTIIKLIHGVFDRLGSHLFQRVASFLHDLHRYEYRPPVSQRSSHLFQRVASFLRSMINKAASKVAEVFSSLSESGFIPTRSMINKAASKVAEVLISFREWLHSYIQRHKQNLESCFRVLISFREWLHSYRPSVSLFFWFFYFCSHLFQRVASFLQIVNDTKQFE